MALHSMGRKHGDPMEVAGSVASGGDGGASSSSSSIALLQERFKKLQKMRERREERKLLKLFSESDTLIDQTKYYERSRNLSVKPEMIYQKPAMSATSSLQDSLSLGLDLYGKKTEHQQLKTPDFRDFWLMDSARVGTSRVYEKPDVDTSLHL